MNPLSHGAPPPPSAPSTLEVRLGHRFHDRALLAAALTPPSAGLGENNQRLEFLGDSVLHLCVAILVCREQPLWAEGALSKLKGLLVCTDALHRWALDLELELRQGPRSARRRKGGPPRNAPSLRNPLADAVEALLAAVFLDVQARGGDAFSTVQAIVERRFLREVQGAYLGIWEAKDSKTTLQERAAAMGLPPPVYALLETSGPDHAPTFTAQVSVAERTATASAGTLKQAQAEAARALLEGMA